MEGGSELHLFILWEAARGAEDRIMADIAGRFSIVRTVEITWSRERFAENLTRFYGLHLPPNSDKEAHVGDGPFLVVIVEVAEPRYEFEETSRGVERVDAEVFAAKARYREWTGGGHKIHSTNSPAEFDHDLALLLGRNAADFRAGVTPAFSADGGGTTLAADLVGAGGWRDLRHLFYVLRATVPHVVMRNFEVLPDEYYAGTHGDIDLLVSNYHEAAFVARATKVFDEPHRVHVSVPVGGDDVYFDLRYVGDGYYDHAWEEAMIGTALDSGGVRVPTPEHHFHGLLYHAVLHKEAVAPDYLETFERLAPGSGVVRSGAFDRRSAVRVLARWMSRHRYAITVPEASVRFNRANAARIQMRMPRGRLPRWAIPKGVRGVVRRLRRS